MIHTEPTPNPESLKFLSENIISATGTEEFQKNEINKVTNPFIRFSGFTSHLQEARLPARSYTCKNLQWAGALRPWKHRAESLLPWPWAGLLPVFCDSTPKVRQDLLENP